MTLLDIACVAVAAVLFLCSLACFVGHMILTDGKRGR